MSTRTRGVAACGQKGPSFAAVNTIEYVTFATMGDGVDFGDATHHVREVASNVSDCHGGIGGY